MASKRGHEPQAEKSRGSFNGSSSTSRDPTMRSIPHVDGNRDPTIAGVLDYTRPTDLKNISEFLGLTGWYAARGITIPHSLPQRPKAFNNQGAACQVTLNTFNVLKSPSTIVHQYDVLFSGDAAPQDYTKRILLKKIWHSKAVKTALGEPANLWIWDTNKLAWSSKRLERDDFRISVDLDAEEKRSTKPGQRGNKHTIFLKHTRKVDFAHLQAFMSGQSSWTTECIDTINFLDHVMREWPSQQYTQIKKSFFQRGQQRYDLGGGVEAFKGVFSSLRPVLDDKFNKSLSVNVDVANGTFWRSQELLRAVCQVFECTVPQLVQRFKEARPNWKNSYMKRDLKRLRRVGVSSTHGERPTPWTIEDFEDKDIFEATFPDPDDRSKKISVAHYFRSKYNIICTLGLPVVKMTKKIRKEYVYLPMDVLKIDANQRYNTKLSDRQTSSMIKFAVTPPKDRWAAIQSGVNLLDWPNDPYLRHYGIKVNPRPSKVQGRVLPLPTVAFNDKQKEKSLMTIAPRDLIQGRWRIDNRRFAQPGRPIRSWGVCCIQSRGSPPEAAVKQFFDAFAKVYQIHGGQFLKPEHRPTIAPWFGPGNLGDGGELIQKAWNQTGNAFKKEPDLLFFIVNDRNVDVYRRIKKSCDLRFGVASQVMQGKHIIARSEQYISNVCMKVNAKMGGITTIVKSAVIPKIAPKSASIRTMVVGADVSHPAPGAGSDEAASFAAITVSADTFHAKYWAEAQTNGNRVEMVTTSNIDDHFGNMARRWMQRIGQGQPPHRVLYIRDGVSEGQYAAVLEEEVRDMKECFRKLGCKNVPKFTVVIAGKRHHIRFFPEAGDRNKNPLPGTLVETGCTHPFEFDFYLCSHVAIKGTARPIHYQCILNEGDYMAAELQSFIFEHSFQYVRSTTPVSLHPAVYYAHLAADRSRAHLNAHPVSAGKKEAKVAPKSSTGSSSKKVEISPLLPMLSARGLTEVMWYV